MKNFSSKEIIKILETDGWYYKNSTASHRHYVHPVKKGKTTVSHPRKSLPKDTVLSIFKQACIDYKN